MYVRIHKEQNTFGPTRQASGSFSATPSPSHSLLLSEKGIETETTGTAQGKSSSVQIAGVVVVICCFSFSGEDFKSKSYIKRIHGPVVIFGGHSTLIFS